MKKSIKSFEYEPIITAVIGGCITYYYFNNHYKGNQVNVVIKTNPSVVKPSPATNLERIRPEPFPIT